MLHIGRKLGGKSQEMEVCVEKYMAIGRNHIGSMGNIKFIQGNCSLAFLGNI
jgi:hypothetical protein